MTIREGEKVWIVPNHGGEAHPAIVIKLSPDGKRALVLSGTGTAGYDIPREVVDPARRANKALKLSKTTYFYQNAVHVRRVDQLECRDTPALRCPLALWEKLQILALAGAKEKLAAKDLREWWPEPAAK
jgi:hypothetical protein